MDKITADKLIKMVADKCKESGDPPDEAAALAAAVGEVLELANNTRRSAAALERIADALEARA